MSKIIQTCAVKDYRALDVLNIHPRNAELRTIEPGKYRGLKKSIVEQGFFEPLLIWSRGNIVLSGNHRLKAARELSREGYEIKSPAGSGFLPVVVQDCSDHEAMGILLQTNTHYAEYIEMALQEALRQYSLLGGDVDMLGFDAIDIEPIITTAVKEADELISEAEMISPEPPELKSERMVSLKMPELVYSKLYEELSVLARRINPAWVDGDNLTEAIQVMTEYWRINRFSDTIELKS